ncbi:centromere protein J-like [Uloborus diversus]|uniref:centromere protein J-like n=1 Tax=Uloborus diversus TaxID=327109 RepID=UPI00240963C9|nr:centromere protein J-like [Uloborus diversus]
MLAQEVTKLQEALSSQKIKYNNDTKKLKNKLVIIEKERDNLKMENIRLDDQCKDLLSTLKERNKKWKQVFSSKKYHNFTVCDSSEKYLEHEEDQTYEKDQCDKVAEDLNVRKSVMKCNDLNSKSSGTKLRVRFDLHEDQTKAQSGDFEAENSHDEDSEMSMNNQANEVTNRMYMNDHLVDETENNVNYHGDDNDTCNSGHKFTDESETHSVENDGVKIQRINDSGIEEFLYPNGTRKVIDPAKNYITFFFCNGDSKEIYPDKKEVYKFANGIIELTLPDGVQSTEFPNGQIQMSFPDGKKLVKFADGTIHTVHSDGSQEIRTPEGNLINIGVDGTETIEFANGQREVRTDKYKRREYPDGSLKIIYQSGRQETRYSDGRLRIKDKEGKLTLDTKYESKGLESKYLMMEESISIRTVWDCGER